MSAPRLYQTDNMEVAVRTLMENHRNVLVYWGYKCIKPIRFRLKVLTDLDMLLCNAWRDWGPAVVDQWRADGGCLLYRPHPSKLSSLPPDTDALLVVECPLQLSKLEALMGTVRQEVVVYRPPTWQLHNETLDYHWPHSSVYVVLDAILGSLVGRVLTEELEGALAASKYPPASSAAFTAWDITQVTGWDEKYLRYIMRGKYMRRSVRYEVYSRRVRPDDADMAWCYDVMLKQPEIALGQYVLRGDYPQEGRLPGFKTQLPRLVKGNYLVREDSVYVVNTASLPRDYERIDAVNNMYRGRWYAVRNLVDSAEEYML